MVTYIKSIENWAVSSSFFDLIAAMSC